MTNNIADCLANAAAGGEIDKARARKLIQEYNDMFNHYRTFMPEAQARARANADFKRANKAKTIANRHTTLHQLRAVRRIHNEMMTTKNPAAAIEGMIEYRAGKGYTGLSVRSLGEAYRDRVNAKIHAALQALGPDILGRVREGKLFEDWVDEIHGTPTGNQQAKKLADIVRDVEHELIREFNSKGGNIPILKNRGIAHTHDHNKLLQQGFDTWADDITPNLAWHEIEDLATGQPFAAKAGDLPHDPVMARRFLKDVYDSITTRGWDDRDITMSASMGGKSLAKKGQDHRVLHFASGRAWLKYNAKYGAGDPWTGAIGGLHRMADDIAQLETLGPNPRVGISVAEQVAMKRAAMEGGKNLAKAQDKIKRAANQARTMLAHYDGSANITDREGAANLMSNTRALQASAHLGSAVLSSVTDNGTLVLAAQTLALSSTNMLNRVNKLIISQMDREEAATAGLIFESMADTMRGVSGFTGADLATGLPQKLANFTMRVTGLTMLTDARKLAFQWELGADLASNAKFRFDELRPQLRKMFSDRGITAADWDMMRAADGLFVGRNGGKLLTPMYWLEHQTQLPRDQAAALAMRWQAAVREQLEVAMPTYSLWAKAFIIGDTKRGTIAGEVTRSIATYRGYPLSLMLNQYARWAEATSWGTTKTWYAVKFGAMMRGLGAVAVQLKEVAKGNDPRPMTDGKFWLAALWQGGGLGIFGDFFAASESRMGGGIAQTLLGPMAGLANDVTQLTAGNALRAFKGEDVNLVRDISAFARSHTPFLSSAWPVRAAYSRLVAEELPSLFDPETELRARRRLAKQARDYGTQPFIPTMGGSDEFRLPDFSNIFAVQP